MNSPYMGKFQVTQTQHSQHDGLDLVGIDSKEIHATVNGTVVYAGWENSNDHSQGFGQYVCIHGSDGRFYYYGHLSVINVKYGQAVKCTDVIGIEGNTHRGQYRQLDRLSLPLLLPQAELPRQCVRYLGYLWNPERSRYLRRRLSPRNVSSGSGEEADEDHRRVWRPYILRNFDRKIITFPSEIKSRRG